jgi:hypothetical protein
MRRALASFASIALLYLPASGWGAEPSMKPSATIPSGGLDCGLWIGRIGSLPVAAWLRPGKQPDTIEGRYGYLRLGRAIPLAGRSVAAGLLLEERGGKSGRPTGQWQATQRKDGAGKPVLKGTWRSPDQKRELPIEMSCVVAADGTIVDARYRPQIGRHPIGKKFQRLLHAGMIAGAVENVGVATMNQVTDVKGGRAYPQLLSLPNPKAMDEINAWIRKESSKSGVEESTGDDEYTCSDDVTLTILHTSATSVTVYEESQDDCGVHPEETETLVTFDISGPHAVQLDLAALLNIDESTAKRNKFTRLVLKQREREGGQGDDATDEGCDEGDGYPPSFSFGAVHGGILVDVDHGAHVTEPCDFQVTLAHRAVKRFFSDKAPQWLREGKY